MKGVTLHDTAAVALSDLSSQFYLTPEDVGKNRAAASQSKLHTLNPAIAVTASSDAITEAFLAKFHVSERGEPGRGGGRRGGEGRWFWRGYRRAGARGQRFSSAFPPAFPTGLPIPPSLRARAAVDRESIQYVSRDGGRVKRHGGRNWNEGRRSIAASFSGGGNPSRHKGPNWAPRALPGPPIPPFDATFFPLPHAPRPLSRRDSRT